MYFYNHYLNSKTIFKKQLLILCLLSPNTDECQTDFTNVQAETLFSGFSFKKTF